MRTILLLISAASLVSVMGCKDSPSSPKGVQAPVINGEWLSPCFQTSENEQDAALRAITKSAQYYLRVTEGTDATLMQGYFSDSACTEIEYYVSTKAKLVNDVSNSDSSRSVDVRVLGETVGAETPRAVEALNKVRFNGETDYVLGEENEINLPPFALEAKSRYKITGKSLLMQICGKNDECSSLDGALPYEKRE